MPENNPQFKFQKGKVHSARAEVGGNIREERTTTHGPAILGIESPPVTRIHITQGPHFKSYLELTGGDNVTASLSPALGTRFELQSSETAPFGLKFTRASASASGHFDRVQDVVGSEELKKQVLAMKGSVFMGIENATGLGGVAMNPAPGVSLQVELGRVFKK